ncbi:MAG: TonB-dependent receptor [Alistipes sp.]
MKRISFLLAFAALTAANAQSISAQQSNKDSMQLYNLQAIEVTATRASDKMPVAYTDLSQQVIASNNYGQDIPFLLALTPSVIATSETGIGVGATSMRMRGSDASRLNVTANGVPMNNPDSHGTYWYDTPDFISAVGTVQVQRGAGTSTNGTGAFGGAVNMTTAAPDTAFGGDASLSYGSYNTNKQAIHIGSGLMGGHWLVDARLTHIGSDGYVDRGATDLKSYMFQGAYYNGNTMVKLLSFGGVAKTYLTYTGVTKDEMAKYGRRYHTDGQYVTSDGPFVLADGTHVNYYDDHTDNYLQTNNQLIVNHRFNERWQMNLTGFYTYGYGYYKQYKDNAKLLEYSIVPAYDKDGKKIKKDLIREKLMRNHFGGVNASAGYTARNIEVMFGGSWSYYTCPHWGELDWMQDAPEGYKPGMEWYRNNVNKQDANLFAKANWKVAKGLNIFADLQYRFVDYEAWGVNDNYDSSRVNANQSEGGMQVIDVDKTYNFFNPKVGLTYQFAKNHTLFASFAIAQKEPTRNDFTDRFRETLPVSEKMYDYELGYQFESRYVTAGVNLYYMNYKDQLVKTGQINDNYDALNINVADSYRRGIELSAAARFTKWFTLGANATFSQNRIKDYTNKVADWDGGYNETYMGTTTISYSPNVISSAIFDFHIAGFEAVFNTQYVSDQYFTNYKNDNMKLDAYCTTNLNLGYTFHTRNAKSVRLGLAIYNLFDANYCTNGYGYSEYYADKDGQPKTQHDTAYYFPQAPVNVLANVTVTF